MKLSRTLFFAMLTAGLAATTSIVPASAAQFTFNGNSTTEKVGNQDVILAAAKNNSSARSAPRSSQRASSNRSFSKPRSVSSSGASKKTLTASSRQNRAPKALTANNGGNKPKSRTTQSASTTNNNKKNTQAITANTGKNRISQTTTRNNGNNKSKTALASIGKPKINPSKFPNQTASASTKPMGGYKPASYKSKLTSTFKSKHKQMPVLGKGRLMPPNWTHNPKMLAGLKGFKNNYKPYWFKSGGQTWFRYYYTYAVAGVAYWYWCNLTPEEVQEQRVVLTSYTSGDCECDSPPPSPPECDCDDDDCGSEE